MQLYRAVGEQHKCRRGNRGLRHVENFDALPHWNGSALEVHALDEPVHLRCGYALAALGGNFFQ